MIKFRGIPLEDTSDIDGVDFDGTFVYGNYVKYGDGAIIVGDALEVGEDRFFPSWWVPVDPKTVGQFTGLKDVNSKDIYEGDIVENERGEILRVSYSAIDASFAAGNCYFGSIGAGKEIRIIGNVHANPELLEKDK